MTTYKVFPMNVDKATPAGFPLCIHEDQISVSHDFWSNVQTNGFDIRAFSDADLTTELPFELIEINTATEVIKAWVRLTSAMSVNDDYYLRTTDGGGESQPAADSTFGSEAVWQDYELVTHGHDMDVDATGNSADATTTGGDQKSGAALLNGWGALGYGVNEGGGAQEEHTKFPTGVLEGPLTDEMFIVYKNSTEDLTWAWMRHWGGSDHFLSKNVGGGGDQVQIRRKFTTTNQTLVSTDNVLVSDAWSQFSIQCPDVLSAPIGHGNGVAMSSPTTNVGAGTRVVPSSHFTLGGADGFAWSSDVSLAEYRLRLDNAPDTTWRALEWDCFNAPVDLATMGTMSTFHTFSVALAGAVPAFATATEAQVHAAPALQAAVPVFSAGVTSQLRFSVALAGAIPTFATATEAQIHTAVALAGAIPTFATATEAQIHTAATLAGAIPAFATNTEAQIHLSPTLSASVPAFAAVVGNTVFIVATLAAAVPTFTASIEAQIHTAVALTAAAPAFTTVAEAQIHLAATLTAAAPAFASSFNLNDTVFIVAAFSAAVPTITLTGEPQIHTAPTLAGAAPVLATGTEAQIHTAAALAGAAPILATTTEAQIHTAAALSASVPAFAFSGEAQIHTAVAIQPAVPAFATVAGPIISASGTLDPSIPAFSAVFVAVLVVGEIITVNVASDMVVDIEADFVIELNPDLST